MGDLTDFCGAFSVTSFLSSLWLCGCVRTAFDRIGLSFALVREGGLHGTLTQPLHASSVALLFVVEPFEGCDTSNRQCDNPCCFKRSSYARSVVLLGLRIELTQRTVYIQSLVTSATLILAQRCDRDNRGPALGKRSWLTRC
jgi:hypothetical protein